MSRYLAHALTRGGSDGPAAGLRGQPLRHISAGEIGLWATEWQGDATLARGDALAHHDLVAAICERAPCLPVRFGTWLASEDVARRSVAEGQARFAAAVDRLGERQEIAVTLLWRDASADRDPTGVGAREKGEDPTAGTGPGRAFLDRKRTAHTATDDRTAIAEALATRLRSELATEPSDVRHETCPSVEVAISMSLLARKDEAGALKARATTAVADLPGVRGVVSGPWPPYSFTAELAQAAVAGGS